MRTSTRTALSISLSLAAFPVVVAGCAGAAGSDEPSAPETLGQATEELSTLGLSAVPTANVKQIGLTSPNVLSPELFETAVAQGSIPLENPAAISDTVSISFYGYDSDGPLLPALGTVTEATKTEPDKNTYLVLNDQIGPDASYDYGRHFIFQGHEIGAKNASGQSTGYITRVNLDADFAHKVTLLATTEATGKSLPVFDGSTWDPWAKKLIFSAELGPSGGLWQATLTFPSVVDDISGSVGRGGYEAIQNDSDGNVWIVEDVGGKAGTVSTHAKQPNSFVYRLVPTRPSDLTQGKLQALQVISLETGNPIAFHLGAADADILSADVGDLHTYGKVFDTHWVTIHDTAVDGTAPFDANAAAKAKLATPFKRPENGQFRPGSGFREFFFDETGDTNSLTEAGAGFGGFGSVLKLVQKSPSATDGKLRLFYLSDVTHSGFDNVAFLSRDHVVFVEDAGDGLHTQRNALDSGYVFDVRLDYSDPGNQPLRIIAEGRDPSATIDSGLLGQAGFQNEGDNEITGIHASNGDPSKRGILGAQIPRTFRNGWRLFYSQQHGDNTLWEVLAKRD